MTGSPASADTMVAGTNWSIAPLEDIAVCVTRATYTAGSWGPALQLAFVSDGTQWDLVLQSNAWNFPANRTYTIRLLLAGKTFTLEMLTRDGGGVLTTPNGKMLSNELVAAFSQAGWVSIMNDANIVVGSYRLDGSSKALTAVAQCGQVAQAAAGTTPFGHGLASNPFERGA
jgi:hypothetical protein